MVLWREVISARRVTPSRALRWRANPTKARRARPCIVCTQGAHMCKFRLSSVSDIYFDIDMHENSHLGLNSLRHGDGHGGDGSFRKVAFRFSGRNQSTCSLMNGYFVGPKTCFDTSIPGVARWMDKGAPGERGEGSANWVVGGNLLEEE